MSYPSLSYTLANGTTADANKVQQNFQDLLNGMSDGTKDLNVNTLTIQSWETLTQQSSTPATPASGLSRVYPKTDGKMYMLDTIGGERAIGGGGGQGSIVWKFNYAPAPLEVSEQYIDTLQFNETDSQGMHCYLTIPDSYVSGTPIYIKGGKVACSATSNNLLFRTTAYLIKNGTTPLSNLVNYHLSTNTQLTAVTADIVKYIGNLDLTTSSGVVDSLTASGGDGLLVFFQRVVASESVAATFSARVIKDSFYPVFS